MKNTTKINICATVSISKKEMKKGDMSVSETFVLMWLFAATDGTESSIELKKNITFMNGYNFDEAEEVLENLTTGGYLKYENRKWEITEAGRLKVTQIATFEATIEEEL